MTKEEAVKEIQDLLATINEHTAHMAKVKESLSLAARGDVTVSCLDDIRTCLSGMAEARAKVEQAKKVVKARIQARLKD